MNWQDLLKTSPIVKQLEAEQAKSEGAERQQQDVQITSARTVREVELPKLDKAVEAAKAEVLKADAALQKAQARLRDAILKRQSVGYELDRKITAAQARLRDMAPPCVDEAILKVGDFSRKLQNEPHSVSTETRWKRNGESVEFVVASNIEPRTRRLEAIKAARNELIELRESYADDYPAAIEAILAKIPHGFSVHTPEEPYGEGVEQGRGGGLDRPSPELLADMRRTT